MPDASPTKWHRAHTTWFFEQFLLKPHAPGYREFDERFALPVQLLLRRGRPAACASGARPDHAARMSQEVTAYRAHVDARGRDADRRARTTATLASIVPIVEIGLHHEQQHQELMLDRHPARVRAEPDRSRSTTRHWQPPRRRRAAAAIARSAGRHPHHRLRRRRLLLRQRAAGASGAAARRSSIARHLVTNGEWLAFMADGGYAHADRCGCRTAGPRSRPRAGTRRAIGARSTAPGSRMTLGGLKPVDPAAPVLPRQLLRGRCLRALGRQAPADRGGMGGCGARRAARRRLRRGLAMDPQRLSAVSRLSRRRRRARRIQRQVHDQPDGAARLVAGDARGPCARRAIAISSRRRRAGSSAACGCVDYD